jgi:2-oxoglutarate/2-oxoacid ferredoxin oxidoreductase subunit beta
MSQDFKTSSKNTWCPGCTNNIALRIIQDIFSEMTDAGFKKRNLVAVTDIGCCGKFYDYLDVNSFYALHGRSLSTAFGIRMANPELKVVAFIGDGGAYAEGVGHLVQLARLNPDLTVLIFNNKVFALTVGQVTPVTETGYRGNTTPEGSIDSPFNPLLVAFSAGASFIARASSLEPTSLKKTIKAGLNHQGFSLIEIIQPCITFRPEDTKELRENEYWAMDAQSDPVKAEKIISSWNYQGGRIPLGIFYAEERDTWEKKHGTKKWFKVNRNVDKKRLAEELLQ